MTKVMLSEKGVCHDQDSIISIDVACNLGFRQTAPRARDGKRQIPMCRFAAAPYGVFIGQFH
jgi:hypothetical protein